MANVMLSLEEIADLSRSAFLSNGCDQANADALVRTVVGAECDGSHSHGLFRVPGYVASLRSGKVNGRCVPRVTTKTPVVVAVDGDNGYAPLSIECGVPKLVECAKEHALAAMAITNTYHFAALWPETERIARAGLVGLACVCYTPLMAPAGGRAPLFGTNPLSFAWPRPGRDPMVIDMATAAMALGEVQIAAREGRSVPIGTGLDSEGNPTLDPKRILAGSLLPFGGYKGSAIALMVELLAAGAIGEHFSFEAGEADHKDGGPPRGGEFILALSPEKIAGSDWAHHCEKFFQRYESIEGARLPGSRRHQNRESSAKRVVNADLVVRIKALCDLS